jgi:RNA polymerase sigma-70 factor (ECF subfamily)
MPSDTAEIGQLYDEHGAEILNYLARRCPEGTARDLLQETFLQVVRQADRLGSVALPRAWLFGIARNILARHYRRNQEPPSVLELAPEIASETGEDPRLPVMREAIAQLAPDLRETLELRLEEELSYEEIARVLEIPIGTVRSRLHHAVRRLRESLTNPEITS